MSVHTRQDLERLSRFTRQQFSHALMSDTKWRKLFTAIYNSDWQPSLVAWKFVDVAEPEPIYMRWPGPNSFWGPPQWVDTAKFGPIELRSIEWLMIPDTVVTPGQAGLAAQGISQDFAAIKIALERVGQFPIDDVPGGLKITGYR